MRYTGQTHKKVRYKVLPTSAKGIAVPDEVSKAEKCNGKNNGMIKLERTFAKARRQKPSPWEWDPKEYGPVKLEIKSSIL